MSSPSVYDAIKAKIVTDFGGTYGIIDWEQIETQLQQGTDPFLAVDDSSGQADLESIGSPQQNWTRDRGQIIVHVFVPSTGGLDAARTLAEQVRNSLRFYRFTVPDGETLRCLNMDPAAPGVVHDGLWHSMLLAVDYEHRFAVPTATP